MDRQYAEYRYSTEYVFDNQAGYAGLELLRTGRGETRRVAKVIYWDACGQYCFETLGADVPVEIVEQLIAETKAKVGVS